MSGKGYGVVIDIILGMVGAVVGGMIMQFLGFSSTGGLIPALLVAILGSVAVVCVARMLKRV